MATFVLIHGAMHGGWCWRDVEPLLREAGHRTYAPTLTGQGDRADLLTPEVGVSTHVDDVVSVVESHGLTDVVLVLHSYAGVLAGPVAQRLTGRLRTVVAAGAFLIEPGECLLDVEPAPVAARYLELAEAGDGWRIPTSPAFLDQWAVTDPRLREFIGTRLTDFPLRCATDRVTFDPQPLAALPRVYLEHTDPPLASLAHSIHRADSTGWAHRRIATGHDLMLTDPEGTAAVLRDLAERSGADTLTDRD